jgi:hypothetical protein
MMPVFLAASSAAFACRFHNSTWRWLKAPPLNALLELGEAALKAATATAPSAAPKGLADASLVEGRGLDAPSELGETALETAPTAQILHSAT